MISCIMNLSNAGQERFLYFLQLWLEREEVKRGRLLYPLSGSLGTRSHTIHKTQMIDAICYSSFIYSATNLSTYKGSTIL